MRLPCSSVLAMMLAMACCAAGVQAEEPQPKPAAKTQEELEQEFADRLSGATLVGYFTIDGEEDKGLKPERYDIAKVTKVAGDQWAFTVRIKYGDKDHTLPVPLVLTVKWAGDTPVITLTDTPVPLFGTFTSRVLIYRDQYAGTWSGADHGGQLFGKIVKE